MSIDLSPELEMYVQEQVKSGRFASAEEVVKAGVSRLMLDDDFDDEDEIRALEEAERQIATGQTFSLAEVAAEYGHKLSGK